MNSDPIIDDPTTPSINSEETKMVEVSPETHALVEEPELTRETEALVDAIKKRAQAEIKGAGDLTRDAYLNAVRQAREALEQNKLLDPERVEYSIWLIQKEAERNWQSILNEVSILGDRMADAARAAWDALTAPRPDSDESKQP